MEEKQGSLSRTGMPKLLDLIFRKNDEASVLDIIREPIRKRFFFKNGVPVAATSNVLHEVLGRLLMHEGIITQQEYETTLEMVLKEKKKHGQVLISMGLISPEQLEAFLTLQVKRRIFKIFGWNEGTYRYTKVENLPEGISHFPVHPGLLILEGISLGFYSATQLKADLRDYLDEKVAAVNDTGRYSLEDFHLNLQEKRFLESLDGKKTLKDALESSDLLKHRALSLALTFIITGLAKDGERFGGEELLEEAKEGRKVVEAPMDSRLNAEILFMRAKSALNKKDYKDAIRVLKEITDLNPVEGEYWAYLGWAIYNENPANSVEAEKIIKDSLDLNNDLDSAWYFLGEIALASNNIEWGERAFRTALSKNPWMLDSMAEIKRLELERIEPAPENNGDRANYVKFFRLSEDPFRNSHKPLFTALSESRVSALEFLAKAVRKKTGPLLLTGDTGVGKTTLLLELLKSLSGDKVLSALILKPEEKELQLIKAINSELGSATEANTVKEQLLSLGMRVSQNKIQGGHTLIIIDEAHNLSHGSLKLMQYLSRLKTLQILLSGEDSLIEKLKEPDFQEFDQKTTARFRLGRLTADESDEYLRARLEQAGFHDNVQHRFTLTAGAARILFEESKGIPSLLNDKGSLLLSAAAKKGTFLLDEELALFTFRGKEPEKGLAGPPMDVVAFADEAPEKKEEAPEALPPGAKKEEPLGEAPQETESHVEAAPESASLKEEKPAPPEPVNIHPTPPTPMPELKRKRPVVKLIIWIALMLIAGLIVGSLIGIFWNRGNTDTGKTAVTTPPPLKKEAVSNSSAGGIDTAAGISTSAPEGPAPAP